MMFKTIVKLSATILCASIMFSTMHHASVADYLSTSTTSTITSVQAYTTSNPETTALPSTTSTTHVQETSTTKVPETTAQTTKNSVTSTTEQKQTTQKITDAIIRLATTTKRSETTTQPSTKKLIWPRITWKQPETQTTKPEKIRSVLSPVSQKWKKLTIDSVGVSVNLTYCDTYQDLDRAQRITDAPNSAFYSQRGQNVVLGDHDYQGFDKIKKCQLGDIAEVTTPDGILKFQMVRCTTGIANENGIWTRDGVELKDFSPSCLLTYTCHGGQDQVWIVMWQPC